VAALYCEVTIGYYPRCSFSSRAWTPAAARLVVGREVIHAPPNPGQFCLDTIRNFVLKAGFEPLWLIVP
jgi:hypothetical protein